MSKLFGTDGIRGKAGIFPIDPPSMKLLGYALTSIISNFSHDNPEIFIGYDTRESSLSIFESICEGASYYRATVYDLGIVPTPLISFISSYRNAYSIAITASHNPYEDNGIKIIGPDGLKLSEATAAEIEKALLNNKQLPALKEKLSFQHIDYSKKAFSLYAEELIAKYFNNLCLDGIHIAVDTANGASYRVIPSILSKLGATVTVFNETPNGRNINDKCGALHPEFLVKQIAGSDVDLGVSYDGDADRAIFCDANGKIYDGDMALAIIGRHMQQQAQLRNDTIIATVMSNFGLEKFLQLHGISLIRVAVGDKYVLEKMLETGCNLGGEQSGHIIFSDILKTGDGLITTLMLLSVIQDSKAAFEKLLFGFQKYPQVLVNVKARAQIPLEEVPVLYNEYLSIKEKLKNKGRIIIRYSGTESLLRIMIEGPSYEEIMIHAEKLSSLAREYLS